MEETRKMVVPTLYGPVAWILIAFLMEKQNSANLWGDNSRKGLMALGESAEGAHVVV